PTTDTASASTMATILTAATLLASNPCRREAVPTDRPSMCATALDAARPTVLVALPVPGAVRCGCGAVRCGAATDGSHPTARPRQSAPGRLPPPRPAP